MSDCQGFFIAGTNTGCGKTWVAAHLIAALASSGYKVSGYKPIASGSEKQGDDYFNEDALRLQQASNVPADYQTINPYSLPGEVSPHIAEQQTAATIQPSTIQQNYQALAEKADYIIVEGAGGWRTPLSTSMTGVDLVKLLDLPVILVVDLELGCINHAVLSAEVMLSDGVQLLGWVANGPLKPLEASEMVVETLQETIPVPMLAMFSYGDSAAANFELLSKQISRLVKQV